MSTAAAIVSARAAQPDLTRAGTRAPATLNAFAVLIAVVVNLIDYGRTLALTVRGHRRNLGFGRAGTSFATRDIHAIATLSPRRSARHSVALPKALWRRASCALRAWLPGLRRDRTQLDQRGTNIHAGATAQDRAPAQATPAKSSHTHDISDRPTRQQAAGQAHRPRSIPLDVATSPGNTEMSPDMLLVPIRRFGGSLKHFIAEVDWCKAPASRIETPRFERAPEHHRPGSLSAEEQSRDHAPPQAASAECSSPEAEPCPETCETFEPTETAPARSWPVSRPPTREVAATALR
ncbi:MAG TPA: hypothetical protein VMB73_23910 [Acetobacteraceae bacterium]|nr:hypothetical protein [Acetobacteraceae bacterium]